MKLLYVILLMSTMLCSDLLESLDIDIVDSYHLDFSYEGESENELAENLEDLIKVNFEGFNFSKIELTPIKNEMTLICYCFPPYLEIHSPPPEVY